MLFKGSPYNEWLDTLVIHFSEGVSLNFSTDFTGGSLELLVFDGSSSKGVTASWNDVNGGGGNIVPGETAVALLNLCFDEVLDDTLRVPYEISGDVFGSAPHVIFDTLVLRPENVWGVTEPESGGLTPGEQMNIDLYFNSGGGDSNWILQPAFLCRKQRHLEFALRNTGYYDRFSDYCQDTCNMT